MTGAESAGSHAAAGGVESDAVVPTHLLNSSMLNSSVADGVLQSGVNGVSGVLNGVRSWVNSSNTDGETGTSVPQQAQFIVAGQSCTLEPCSLCSCILPVAD